MIMTLFINGLLIFILCFTSLNVLREIYYFYQCYRRVERYEISNLRMIGLWASISYILTIILV